MSRTPSRPGLAAALVVALASGALAACTSGGDAEDPADVAERLADGLSDHTLTGVPLVDTSAVDSFAELVGPLDEQPVEVTVGEVAEGEGDDAGEATATLAWTWRLGAQEWTYESTADLVESGGAWAVAWSPATLEPSLTDEDRLGLSTVAGERGEITGDADAPIVVDRPVERYGLDKTRVRPAIVARSARRVAEALDLDVAPYVARAREAGDSAFVEGIVLRPGDARRLVPASFGDIPGAVVIGDELPLAPTREFAAPILGRVGPVTAELVEQSDGRLEAGDTAGLSGLQLRYDELLRPVDGARVVAARGTGQATEERTLVELDPSPGEDLATTLDVEVQRAAEQALLATDVPAALVALRPSDGAVLAAASGPGSAGINTATEGQYAPGSTFKVVSSLALLRAGVSPGDTLACPATLDVDGRTFGNYDDYPAGGTGDIDLRTALANSCNTAFIGARGDLGDGDLADAAAALGLGEDADVGFPAYFGQVPAPEGETEAAAAMIGQGRVLASPLAMATVAASVAAGRTVVPTLLPEVEPEATEPSAPLTATEARTLQVLMRGVVTDGSASFLADVPGQVGAKTGTAEYGEPGTEGAADGELPTHAWMIAIDGDLAVAVFVETGASGSSTAGPILEDFLTDPARR